MSVRTHGLAGFTVKEFFHGLKADDGVLNALEEGARPHDSPCYWWLVLGDGRAALVILHM